MSNIPTYWEKNPRFKGYEMASQGIKLQECVIRPRSVKTRRRALFNTLNLKISKNHNIMKEINYTLVFGRPLSKSSDFRTSFILKNVLSLVRKILASICNRFRQITNLRIYRLKINALTLWGFLLCIFDSCRNHLRIGSPTLVIFNNQSGALVQNLKMDLFKITTIALCFTFLSCKKETKAPVIENTEPVESTVKVKYSFNYSTTPTSTLTQSELLAQSVDTTYYQISNNGKVLLKWKANWNFNSRPELSNVEDLSKLFTYNVGDIIIWQIAYRTTRNVSGYAFDGGITTEKGFFGGTYYAYSIPATSTEYYVPGYNSFVQEVQYIAK